MCFIDVLIALPKGQPFNMKIITSSIGTNDFQFFGNYICFSHAQIALPKRATFQTNILMLADNISRPF